MGSELNQALAMIDAFTSVRARGSDVTILDINGDEVPGMQRPRSSLVEVRRMIGRTLQDAARNQHSVIIRPRSAGPRLIQLDDLDTEKAERVAPYAFIEIETSPGNRVVLGSRERYSQRRGRSQRLRSPAETRRRSQVHGRRPILPL